MTIQWSIKRLKKEFQSSTEVELAYLISEAPIIGITGSNGKTTTTTMIAEVLTAWWPKWSLVWKYRFSSSVKLHKQRQNKDTLVMELSSFQLMGIEAFHPEIAVITNLMPTHIDYHGSFEELCSCQMEYSKEYDSR